MDQECICDSSVELIQTLCFDQELEILLPEQLVLLELTASTIVEVHDAALDAVVVSKVCLSRASLVQGLLCLDLDALEIPLVLDGSEEIVDRGILALELILMVAA